MPDWMGDLAQAVAAGQMLAWGEDPLPGRGRALMLAPHPDDPDAVAVTLRLLVQGGWDLRVAVAVYGWTGVQNDFAGPDPEVKRRLREEEQRASMRLFGLPEERLTFLRLAEQPDAHVEESPENLRRLYAFLDDTAPDLVLLPHGDDSHLTHRRIYAWLTGWAQRRQAPPLILGNRDPKTLEFRTDFQVEFGEATAAWKTELLECHRSQSARNQQDRGFTFAERILGMNRLGGGCYAERFQRYACSE